MLEIGTQAPDFTLNDQDGNPVSLSDFRGKKVILYFYPKDNTPGCTKQACAFGELYPQILEKGATVIGISKDTVSSHKKFQEKYTKYSPKMYQLFYDRYIKETILENKDISI